MALLTAKSPVKEEQCTPPDGRRLVFVGGAPRSGTTLVQHMLDSNPAVFGGPEFDCIPNIVETWRNVVAALLHGRITVFCSRQQIDTAFAALIESLLLQAVDACGARLLSEKTPFNVLVFTYLLELFPCCRAIHVVRDPRATIASLLQVGLRKRAKNEIAPPWTLDLHAAIELVRQSVECGFRAVQRFPERILTVCYEVLVSRPEQIAREICTFLGLAFDPAMLEPHAREHPGQASLAQLDNGIWLDPKLGFRPIETSRVNVWRDHLKASQIAAVNDAFREVPFMRDFGYCFE
jgi:hypothetical protein